jgi:hypothetical protein
VRITKSQLKQIVIEESQIVLAERKEQYRQKSIMLAESKRIDAIHEEMLDEISMSSLAKEIPHLALDVAGLIPGWGEAADLSNAALYASRGKPFMAALSVISMIPVVGDIVGKGGKLATFMAKTGDDAAKASIKLGGLLQKHFPKIKTLLTKLKSNKALAPYIDDMLAAVTKYIDDAAKGGVSVGQDALEKVQQALMTKPVKKVDSGKLKDIAQAAMKNRAARKRKEMIAGDSEEQEAAE